jgi:outer membrane protein assembly factor BamB
VTPGFVARSGRFAGWKVAAVVLVLAAVAGAAIVLQVRGWSALEGQSGSACGSGSAACPRGVVPVLVVSFVAGLAAIPLLIAAVVRRPKVNAGVAVAGLVVGVFAAQSLSGWLNGTQLRVDWTAPYDASATLITEGVWTAGGSLIRVRADEIVSYDAATGRQQWTQPVPAGNVACAVSAGTAAGAGLIAFGAAGGACDHVLAVDLGTGRQLWSRQVAAGWKGDQGTGFVAVGGDTAVVVTAGGTGGYDLRTGAPRWTSLTPGGCSDQTVAAAAQSAVVLAACGRGFDVIDLDPASGSQRWSTPVSPPAPDYQFAILSAAPVVVSDVVPGTPSADHVLAFGADGTVVSTIPADGLDTSDYQGFGPEAVVSGGLLVGVTRPSGGHSDIVAYRLSDGSRLWQLPMPDHVLSLRQDGGQLLVIDQSAPVPTLDAIALPGGTPHAIGLIPRGVTGASGTGVYPAGGRYLMVNLTGRAPVPPVAALSGLPVSARRRHRGRPLVRRPGRGQRRRARGVRRSRRRQDGPARGGGLVQQADRRTAVIPTRYPNIKIINSHLGGALPMLLQRADDQYRGEAPDTPELPSVAARRMWYDSVGHGIPGSPRTPPGPSSTRTRAPCSASARPSPTDWSSGRG